MEKHSDFVMVPCAPTVAMRDAGRDAAGPRRHLSVTNIYAAMLAAAPPLVGPVAYLTVRSDEQRVVLAKFVGEAEAAAGDNGWSLIPLYAQSSAPVVVDDGYVRGLRRAAEIALEENQRRIRLASIRIPALATEIRDAILAEANAAISVGDLEAPACTS